MFLSSLVCDAPARAFVKNTKLHSGYYACEKCNTEGELIDSRMCFPETNARPRTDESFRQMLDEEHHMGPNPLRRLTFGMVTQVPIDYRHLVCLGVVKRLIRLWRTCVNKSARISLQEFRVVSGVLESLSSSLCKEFARSPRSLSEVARWKATEFRTFLLYTGVVALHGNVPDAIYNNFLLLSCGIHILANPKLCSSPRTSAAACELLLKFVAHYQQLFG